MMVGMGATGAASQFTLIKAIESAPAVTATPFNYTNLIWATLFGFILFGDAPDLPTITGAALIATSGLYIFRRERVERLSVRDWFDSERR